jgi:hypothetical protein
MFLWPVGMGGVGLGPERACMCSQENLDKFTKWFWNASAVTWSLVLQMRNLANKIEEF